LYSTDWYNQTPGFKRLLPLAIMRASKPVKVKAGVFYDLSFVTFAAVCGSGRFGRLFYSVFMSDDSVRFFS
jgi:hypothetical protein